ncbi:MAG: hypothetical protein A2X68_13770 [Ignavibacteria bacterium GWC2_56_12]|nr:MAG: hypothetical protein A2X68_13770 [Ignavibacteria bacterium GWC2_56_12]
MHRMNTRLRIAGTALLTTAIAVTAFAQVPQVRISQYAEAKQRVGLSDVTVTYHRPGVKGRVIWGELQKYDQVWRAGANEPTVVTFSDTVWVGNDKLNPGQYRLVVFPRKQGPWTIVFNSEVKNWGTMYDSTYDALHVSVAAASAPHEEWMSFSFTDLTGSSTTLVLRWEEVALNIPLRFNTSGKFAAAQRMMENGTWQSYNAYARYLIDYNGDMKDALKASEKAVGLMENAGTLRTKAEVLEKSGNAAEAIKTAERAIQVGKAANPNFNATALNDLIKGWKEKAGK